MSGVAANLSERAARVPPRRRIYRVLALGPFAILVATAWWLAAHWSEIPARFPTSWDFQGNPSGWATRSFLGVFGLLLLSGCICLVLAFVGYATLHWSQHERGGADARQRRLAAWCPLAAEYILAVVFSGAGLLPFAHGQQPHGLLLAAVLITAAVIIPLALAWKAEPDGAPEQGDAGEAASAPLPRHDESHWVAGFLYYNPDDPAVFVPKRWGWGLTLNFAQRRSWLLLLVLGALPLAGLLTRALAGR